MTIYFNPKDNFLDSSYFKSLSNEEKLSIYDNLITQLGEALEEDRVNPYSRMSNDTKCSCMKDLSRLEKRRKLLVESMGVLNKSGTIISPVSQNFLNSQVHYGQGDNTSEDKVVENKYNKKEWYEKPFGIIGITMVAGIVIGGLLYLFGWN